LLPDGGDDFHLVIIDWFMKENKIYILTLIIVSGLLLTRCSKKEDFPGGTLTDYMNLGVGKYVTYRLDSLVYTNFGQTQTTIKYQAKDVVDGTTTDNLGRPTWRILRYLNDTAASGPWVQMLTYYVTPTRETIEVIENNFRYQKLKLPITNGFSWKGNSYIDTYSINSNVRYLDDWDYTYDSANEPYTLYNKSIDSTVTVDQRDETLGTPNNPDAYSEHNYSQEVYAKGIGLVYKNFLHWVFQPRNSSYPNGYTDGYGITLRMIDHN